MARGSLTKCVVGLLTLQSALGSPVAGNKPPVLAEGKLGAVASGNEICSHIGTDLLKIGGNAADAMVGTVVCMGVIGMYHSGIGGGGFMLVRAPNGTYEFIDFRETAPAAAYEDMFKNNVNASITGGLASGVPGELRGLQYLHEHYGALPWAKVLAPAVKVARDGWKVNEDLVRYMASATATAGSNFLVDDKQFAIDFAPNGQLLKLGETITRKRFADTLETVANKGPDAFYKGPIAEATIRALQASNGTMTLQDLADYKVAIRKPSTINYRNYKLTACGAPSGGDVALSTLKFMEGYSNVGDPSNINLTTHRLDESMKFAYALRAELGDPFFVKGMDKYQEQIHSEATAKEIRSKIYDNKTFEVSYYNPLGLESLETPGTAHVVSADASGMAITLTTTVNLLFGSRFVVPETGVIMNCQMNDFSIPGQSNSFGFIPSAANFIRPGKRPLSSISPVIVEHLNSTLADAFYVAIGAAGGSRIITATVQNLINILDGNMTTAEALAAPRMHDQLVPAQVSFEYGFDNGTTAFLKNLGANVTWSAPTGSSAQGLRRLANGTFEAAGEPRQKNSGGVAV
ncbi:Ggt Gamma-glutamyltransferase [Pyrenophora tritici-repentis]|uniref:Glutathione hydrolase n=2 Tax=Pyrenophora tritici-repentis TaxID=45151 RepID=A0A2W1F8D3_9PLEO|nr:gamma-glutamyltranspeptidase 1 precursor [Pyrenophora tritici-repentis Pt-1C-BFP]KAA8623059.1 Gamma-glutamyltranspeptidase [Pyrenophora tritici-repentis]EDU45387.1 gamma-glutamyltranspeptidase 1 precursor [Pyrenophora tritici-repentis Pt-1C-BFP]KAF7452051.1 Gamma-glutamyltranspeptidase [Pyrenophora tritici-repentis]KAF7574832.1 Ggt, Gamma-glutamyltransferase [Pyrenophora tritici-repentis]KAG9386403.1 Gamma-glutamyltranspeptidase [Pyrenophora tritici-repentis]